MKLNNRFKKKFSHNVGKKLQAMDQLKQVRIELYGPMQSVREQTLPTKKLIEAGWLDLNQVR